jgi:glutathione S-transferase
MRLYHVPNSSSQRVVWLLEEIGQPYELVVMGDRASRLEDPDHVRRHPLGRVPVLEDEGGTIFESGAICLYLADRYPAAELLPPPGTHERGLTYQWSLFAYSELQGKIAPKRLATTPESVEAAGSALADVIGVIDRALDGRDFLVGDRFTVADLLVSTALASAQRWGGAELPPSLGSYLESMQARPARRRADARNG